MMAATQNPSPAFMVGYILISLTLGCILPSVNSTITPTAAPIFAAQTTERPTNSPVELSDVTQLANGGRHVVGDEASSFSDESIIVRKKTTLILEEGGYIVAPLSTTWPAVRLLDGSIFNGTGGYIKGSLAGDDFNEGGEAIDVSNGESGPETASYAEFYGGVSVFGGDAPGGKGGNAMHLNGYGTKAVIYGGNFIGGTGLMGDGLSILVLNSGRVHIHGGTFQGDMEVTGQGSIQFYGCFKQDGSRVTGIFVDETELDVTVQTKSGGQIMLIPVADLECDIAPSTEPTAVPTVSPQPTATNRGAVNGLSVWALLVDAFVFLHITATLIHFL